MDQAIETLASPDVTVTNQSDKELQLYKLRELDSLVLEAVLKCTTTSNHDASRRIERQVKHAAQVIQRHARRTIA